MNRKAKCWNNAAMESFFKTLKVERVHRLRYASRVQAKLDLVDWIEGFYNSNVCIRRSIIAHPQSLNAASKLHESGVRGIKTGSVLPCCQIRAPRLGWRDCRPCLAPGSLDNTHACHRPHRLRLARSRLR
ncbi:MAG: IS3 family transposase [Gammaproteobacteria bacterium]|nr:IS3 family transposase [Gammaproteobacteria bacterium]